MMNEATKRSSDHFSVAGASTSTPMSNKKAKLEVAAPLQKVTPDDGRKKIDRLPAVSFDVGDGTCKRDADSAPTAGMNTPTAFARTLTITDYDGVWPPTPAGVAAGSAASKTSAVARKTLDTTRILTFTADNDNFARLQLLSTHTLHDLVWTLCQHTSVGFNIDDKPCGIHTWHVIHNGKTVQRNETMLEDLQLVEGCTLMIVYRHGKARTYTVTLAESEKLAGGGNTASYPRNQSDSAFPQFYQRYQPNTGAMYNLLDTTFYYLNNWMFRGSPNVSAHLFQAGRKKNYGYMDNGFTTIYLPAKPDGLANWLECFNRGASVMPAGVEADGYTHYTWQSVVPLPRARLTQQLTNKYASNEKSGFCDAPVVEDHYYYPGALTINLERMFPRIAALAGLKKDKCVPKGWISFTKRGNRWSLVICKGSAREPRKSRGPRGLAFEGEGQHDPAEEPLFRISGGVEIQGLHDLFCVVEGLLRTL